MAGTIVDDNLGTLNDGRALMTEFGLRTHRVYLRSGQWDGGEVYLGSLTATDVELTPRPKVEKSGSGSVKLTGITPNYPGGGWSPSVILPDVESGKDFYFLIRNPRGDVLPYTLTSIDSTGPFGVELALQILDLSNPDY